MDEKEARGDLVMRVEGWTESKFFSFIRSALRRAFTKYPNKYKALNAARRVKKHAKGRQKWEYRCASCTRFYAGKSVQVDHIIPAGSLRSFSDLPDFCSRLFCSVEGLQVLCHRCHTVKTNTERGIVPEIAAFKKLPAKKQIAKLKRLELEVGSNAAKRIEIFTR